MRESQEAVAADPKQISVCFIVGDNLTNHCGVKDYAQRLADELTTNHFPARIEAPSSWSLPRSVRFSWHLHALRANILHIQYPSIGFRYSLVPHLLGRLRLGGKTCVTLHEYSSLPLVQRLSLHLFRWTAQAIIFTTDNEREHFRSLLGVAGAPHLVIPIASNVPVAPVSLCRKPNILYFGQIRPNKGIEAFLELARISSQEEAPFCFQVIGSCLPRNIGYLTQLKDSASGQIEWLLDQPLERVAERMSHALAAYLPFPDGATYRRGSLLAALANGLPVVSVINDATPSELSTVILAASDPPEALRQILHLDKSPNFATEKQQSSRQLGEKYSWPVITREHILLYNRVIRRYSSPQA